MYSNLAQINTNLISTVYKTLLLYNAIPSPLLCVVIVIQIISSCILCPSIQIWNYCFMQLSFKSGKREKVYQKKYTYTMFYIYLCSYLYWFSVFLVQIQVTLRCPFLYFSLKDSFSIFKGRSASKNFSQVLFILECLNFTFTFWSIGVWNKEFLVGIVFFQ